MSLIERVLENAKERREKILSGKVNCIPSPFKTFRYDFPGVELGTYYLVSGGAKSSKSKITNFLFLFNSILYAYHHPELVRLKVFYALLEEKAENITGKFICYLLYILSDKKIRIDIKTFKSVDEDRILSPEILELLGTLEYQSILKFFEEHVVFIPDRNPTGVYHTLEKYAEANGTIHRKKVEGYEKEIFDYYEPNDPDEYVLCIIDHISLISCERSMDLRNSIKKLSEYLKIVRNKYNYIPVVVQQQNSESLSLEAFKANKIRPTQKGLADSQDPGKDCDVMLGITSPFSWELKEYLKYDITKLRGYCKFLEIVLGRDGESNAILGMYFDGATGYYAPLPKYDNIPELNKVYQLIQRNQESTSK
nr:MAG TPA: Helicase ATPase [Caudoviricetes sp.]